MVQLRIFLKELGRTKRTHIFILLILTLVILVFVVVRKPSMTINSDNSNKAGIFTTSSAVKADKDAKPLKNTGTNMTSEFFDDFTRPDGLIADNYGTEDSLGKWEVTSQKFFTDGSRGYTKSPIFRAVTRKSDFSDFILSSDMMKTNLGDDAWDGLQLFFRYKDYNNLYAAGLRNDNHLQLKKKVNGAYYTLAMVPMNSNKLNHWYGLKVIAKADRIQVYVDGAKYIDTYDGSLSSGRVGIRTDNVTAFFDNYTLKV